MKLIRRPDGTYAEVYADIPYEDFSKRTIVRELLMVFWIWFEAMNVKAFLIFIVGCLLSFAIGLAGALYMGDYHCNWFDNRTRTQC